MEWQLHFASVQKKIYISGMHSGQSPSPGLGVANCIRKAFPDLFLVGVDHWQGSSGLHDPAINEVLLFPQWKQIIDTRHATQIRSILEENNLWISSIDMEVHWLAENLGSHKNLIAPGLKAIELTAKPKVEAFSELGFRVADFISANSTDADLHAFLRQNSWQCWLKSPYHDAKRISSWEGFARSRDKMAKDWNTEKLFLQSHIIGNEEAICFAALRGELLSAIHLEKRILTPEGKTWAGRISPLEPELFTRLQEIIRRLEWSGGGELEYTRDPDGNLWIIECNPRFPAWIYGAALVGMYLPAKIISRAWDLPLLEVRAKYPFFNRVVNEILAKESVGIPLIAAPSFSRWSSDAGKGKGASSAQASLPNLKNNDRVEKIGPEVLPELYYENLNHVANYDGHTPMRIPLMDWAHSRFKNLEKITSLLPKKSPEIRIAYSVKTSPTDFYLQEAKSAGFYIECISQKEVQRVLKFGFTAEKIILNGPGKFWPLDQAPAEGLHLLFCDSIEEFDRVVMIPNMSRGLGFRMKIPGLASRFGVSLAEFSDFERILASITKMNSQQKLCFHFHMPSWAIGLKSWWEAFQSLLQWCQSLEQMSGVAVKYLDLGGGFFPLDLEQFDFSLMQKNAMEYLPSLEALYFEPGRALTQDAEVLFARILDIRKDNYGELTELVLDACIADLPMIHIYSHKIFYRAQNENKINLIAKGKVRLLGRICMEDDVLSAGVEMSPNAQIGDFIIFGNAGAYGRSMSYEFGCG